MFVRVIYYAFAACLFLAPATSQAVTVSFQGGPQTAEVINFSSGGFTVTATATEDGATALVGQNQTLGIGVNGTSINSDSISPSNPDLEILILEFGSEIQVETLTLSNVSANDSFRLFADGVEVDSGNIEDRSPGQTGSVRDVDFSSLAITGTIFQITNGSSNNDVFSLASFNFTAVPLPAPIALLLAGLAGLIVVGRKRII
ncbi:MAG: hypothetical protein AAGC81_12245 [Pseudomonadota bacterium]